MLTLLDALVHCTCLVKAAAIDGCIWKLRSGVRRVRCAHG